MSFTSIAFLCFLLLGLVVYYLVPGKWQWMVLLAASWVFYYSAGWHGFLYLAFTTISTYVAGLLLGKLNKERSQLPPEQKKTGGERIKRKKKWVVAGAICLNFGLLFVVKYYNFTAQALHLPLPSLNLLVPLGLSFYMFQSIGYVVDCYRGKYEPQRNLAKFSLFTSFFPQLIQGPISRYNELGPQLLAPHKFQADNLKYGIQLAMWGYLKKMIADRAAVPVNTIFGDLDAYGGAFVAIAVAFYCIQLYCDFSGGIDIAIGAAQMFGIEVTPNFRRPIFATTLTDFWRRWHITLGTWMKDYVFYPMSLSKPLGKLGKFTRRKFGGKLGKIIPTSIATFTVYFIIGIWHGANFRYIFFGFWNGIIITGSFLLAGPLISLRNLLHIRENSLLHRWIGRVRTMLIVFVGRYITRAPRLLVAFSLLWKTVSTPCLYQLRDGTFLSLGLKALDYWVIGIGVVVILALEWFQEQGTPIRKTLEKKSVLVQWLCIFLPLLILLVMHILGGEYISSEFIYKQF